MRAYFYLANKCLPKWLYFFCFFIFIPLILLLISPIKISALDPKKDLNQYILNSWQDGLPHLVIRNIIQSKDGYLWLATYEGLVRFDGVTFTVFDKKNTPQFQDNRINAIYQDNLGNIWVGTGKGLLCYQKGKFISYTTKEGLPGNTIYSVYQDNLDNLWIGTNQGLASYKDSKFTIFTTKEGLSNNLVSAIFQDKSGVLWFGTGAGVNQFTNNTFTSYKLDDTTIGNFVNKIFEDKTGMLWIGTNGGLKSFQDGKIKHFGQESGLSYNSISSILEDRDGTLWFGGYGTGLIAYRQEKFITFSTDQGFSDNIIRSLYEDKEGSLWIGTNSGLSRLRDGILSNYTTKNGLLSDNVRSVYQARDGSIWIGTDGGGVSKFYQGQFTNYTLEQGLANKFVRAVYEDKEGNIWIGTNKGLNKFSQGKFSYYPINDIFSVYQDSIGNIWVGTYGNGVYSLSSSKINNYTTKDGLPSNIVRSICEDLQGNIWFGTEGGGLACFRDGKFTIYNEKNGLSGNTVLSIYLDKDGYLWIGTQDGINRFKDGEFFLYSIKSGLFDDVAFQILTDDKESFWISCNKGIYQVSRQDLMDYANDKIAKITYRAFSKADGMETNQCNGNSQPAGCKSADGRLWFPTVKGLVSIDPNFEKKNSLAPNVVIEQFTVDEQFFYPEKMSFSQDNKTFKFYYTALSFIAPERVKFKYILENFDSKWSSETSLRFAIYNNLPAGNYIFKVVACNSDGVWNEIGASYQFSINPYWWETPWVYGGGIFGLLGLFYLGVRFRERRFLLRNLELEAKVVTRTKELDKKNEELAGKLLELDGKNHELDKKNEELASKNAALVRSRDEIIQSNKRAELIFSALSDVLPGTVLDEKYRIEKKIGAGGFGLVYRATHLTLMREVAVKIFRPSSENTSLESLERFRREGITGSRINHPNAVAVLDSGVSTSGIAYLVMELLEGHTLTQELEQEKILTPWRCAEIIIPVCEALEAAHTSGLVHRDIKPDNIFLHQSSQGEVVKVVDFGIAKLVGDTLNFDLDALTQSGIVGTPTFIAPERLSNKHYDGQADVYSVGVMLYRMLAGRLPFQIEDKNNVWAVALMHLKENPPKLRNINPSISVEIEELVMRLLDKEPENRPKAKEVAKEFAQIVGFQANLKNTGKVFLMVDDNNVLEANTIKINNATSEDLTITLDKNSTLTK